MHHKNTVLKEIRGLGATKASRDNDLLVKMLKENADYFAEFWKNYEQSTVAVVWKTSLKIPVWFLERLQYSTLSPFNALKMETYYQ